MKKGKVLTGNSDLSIYKQDKIEILNCPHSCMNCKSVLTDINRYFSENHQINKEYLFSIVTLKKAFETTFALKEPVGKKCAKLYRVKITESLENISQELKRMTNGFFHKGRYENSYLLAEETLKEFKKDAPAGPPTPAGD